jgi:hypothetical protein
MRKLIHLKIFSLVLLAVILTVTVNGVYGSASSIQSHVTDVSDQEEPLEISAPLPQPCSPFGQCKDYDGCDTCVNCACHTPLPFQQFQLSYNPIISDVTIPHPFMRFPEVYLSKFIPPQNLA